MAYIPNFTRINTGVFDSTDGRLKMVSGVCYLPRNCNLPKSSEQDAYFVCDEEGAIGVADGADHAGDYARELMTRSVYAVQDEFQTKGGVVNLRKALNKAFSNTKSKGSSTVCMVTLQGSHIHGINVGNSGFEIFRDSKFQCRSAIQRRGVDDTFRLGNSSMCDKPNCAQQMRVTVKDGDVVVVGTDGLFDNVASKEIEDILEKEPTKDNSPEHLARKIAELALHNSMDKSILTPFAEACQEAGYNYVGGKVDDITVIVGLIQKAD
ncbi:putative Phosphatase 2C 55 [Tripterygium wilfordii]|uniref:Protein phosphatase n=1 Tax=Tripterygium wilfordii TaxID=458696 RepID=A0A7J7C3F6_TRIWF|nr:probable protein phosphatase 2C 80 [Tripterygium wilfordii]KAF5728397.1 putative Phosphatase 2C 55 [Tripterygium wilfordii]